MLTKRSFDITRARAKSLVRRQFLPAYQVYGSYDEMPLRALIVDDGSSLEYLLSVISPSGSEVKPVGLVPALAAHRLVNANQDIVAVAANRFLLPLYSRTRFHLAPKWMRLCLSPVDHPDALISRLTGDAGNSVRKNVRKMKERGFSSEVTTDPAWMDRFYHRMFVPYALQRFGKLSDIESYERLKGVFEYGFGMIVRLDGREVGGALLFPRGSSLWFHRMGIVDGDQSLNREGFSTALYYDMIALAHEQGFESMDFGHCRPFASDGVLRYKLKWGMSIVNEDDSVAEFALAAPGPTDVGRRFFAESPFYEFAREGITLCNEP